ncbi:MAG: restriction endonuclease subunit S [Muribaculaceae bacterium]|nr:restriction endonuclease subunit S [Muribaculaceae bacterium]
MKTAVVCKSSCQENNLRLDPSFHLSEGVSAKRAILNGPYGTIPCGKAAMRIFNGGRYKRIYVTNPQCGIPLISSSGILKADLSDAKLVSKKFSPEIEDRLVQKGWILISRSGTIGNTAFTNSGHAQKLASEDVIRLVPNDILRAGYLYAFLSSKFGYELLTQGTFGAVIQHIECPHVANIPVPVFPDEMQKEIDTLIREAASLRDKAAELLSSCISEIEDTVQPKLTHKSNGRVSIKDINNSHNIRFEANYHISDGSEVDKFIRDNFEWKSLSEVCHSISRPDIFKRYYVRNGIPFLGGSDIFLAIPDGGKFLSKTKTSNISALTVENGWILMPRSGTIGNVVLSHDGHAQKLVSEDVIRLKPNDILRGGYVYAFLSSSFGKALIQRPIFGAVIQHVESPHLSRIPIPVLDDDIMSSIHERIMTYKDCLSEACRKELKAISMVEAEIESWDKNEGNK